MSGVMNIDGCGGEDEIMSNTYVPSGVRVHPRCRRRNTRREMSVSYYKGKYFCLSVGVCVCVPVLPSSDN